MRGRYGRIQPGRTGTATARTSPRPAWPLSVWFLPCLPALRPASPSSACAARRRSRPNGERPGEWGQQTLFPPAVSFLESWFPALLFPWRREQYGGVQDVLVGEIQAPYDFDLVGEALLHAADDRRGVGQLEALRTFDGDYRSRDLVGRDVRIMEPSVLSVASMCRAVIFGSFSMRRVRFFPGHVPAVLTSVDAGRACGPIGASANQDGGSAWASWIGDESQKRHRSTTQSRHPFRSRGRWRKGHWRGSCRPRRKTWSVRECYALASFLCLRV